MIKRLFFFTLFISSTASAANIVSQQNGYWGTGGTWVGGVVPGNGDTVKIFHVIQDTDTRFVGTSPASGTVVVDLQSTGTIQVINGGYLKVRGDIQYTHGAANTTDGVIVSSGGTLEFDSSLANAPLAQHYGYYADGSAGYRTFRASGTAAAYATVLANSSSGQAKLTANGQTDSGIYVSSYTAYTNMAFDVAYNNGGTADNVGWIAMYSTFTNCGLINAGIGGNMQPTSTFRHEFNLHKTSTGSSIFFMNFYNQNNGGVRSIKNNIFDVPMNDINGQGLGDFNVQNNYMGQGFSGANSTWSVFTNNFIRVNPKEGNFGISGPLVDTILWSDTDGQNPHIYTTSISSNQAITGAIFEQEGITRTSPSDDSGEFWLQSGPTIVSTVTISSSIFLMNGAGYSSLEITSLLGTAGVNTYTNNRFVCEHNTYFGGWDNTSTVVLPPFAAVDFSESSNMAPGTLTSFRSNLLWNPLLASRPITAFFKTLDVANVGSDFATGFGVGPTQDVCSPARCDYNGSYGAVTTSVTFTNSGHYTNEGNGYIGKYSSTPGVHDVNNQNPNFVDYKRYIEKFDSAYYRPYWNIPQPPAWASNNSYNAGDTVNHSSGTFFWGDTLNYVYVSTGFCNGRNPEPGTIPISNWTQCWQTATVQDLQTAILSSMTFTDTLIGVNNSDINQTLLKWIRAGYAPTNTAYLGTAHDGTDIGAVPVYVQKRKTFLGTR